MTVACSGDIVLLGAGHAHVGVLRSFGFDPAPGVRLTLVTRHAETPYSGMLPGLIAGLYQREDVHIDTVPLTRFAGAQLVIGEAVGIDTEGKRVICREGPPIPYDVLSIDIGSTPSARHVPGVSAHAIPVKPIDGFLAQFEAARARILSLGGRARIGVVGAGAGGVELILALHRRLTRDVSGADLDASQLHFTLIGGDSEILPAFPSAMRRRFASILGRRRIEVLTGGKVTAVLPDAVDIERHGRRPLDEVFWTTEAEPAAWLADSGLALDKDGFIRVTPALQSVSHPDVFAAGDVAMIDGHPTPRSGVYAVRAAGPLAANLHGIIGGQPLVDFKPQRDALYLVSTGERYAIGTRNGITLGGGWVWTLKDWIDRRFMAQYKHLPEKV